MMSYILRYMQLLIWLAVCENNGKFDFSVPAVYQHQ
jgi:hypothetical protein